MNRPWPATGFGWILAVIALLLTVLVAVGVGQIPLWLPLLLVILAVLL